MDTFTSHNVLLPGGECTIPGTPLLADGPYVRSILRTLDIAFAGDVAGKSIVDLGCLEGGWTVEFARAGFNALGIEARKLNVEKCQYVADRVNLPNLRFVLDDVRNIDDHGPFDAVFCAGLLYHLDSPTAYIRTLASATRRLLLLHTHFSRLHDTPLEDGQELTPSQRYQLSPIDTHEGNLGRWYPEYPRGEGDDEVEQRLWASYGNHRSFWIEKCHLLQTLRNVGFAPVYEQFDWVSDNVTDDFIHQHDRSLFVAYRGVEPLEPGTT